MSISDRAITFYLTYALIIGLSFYLRRIVNGRVINFSAMIIVGLKIQRLSSHYKTLEIQLAKISPRRSLAQSFINIVQVWQDVSTSQWNELKLRQLLAPSDIPSVLRIRPSLSHCEDLVSWSFTKDGLYSDKLGYNLLRDEHLTRPSPSFQLHQRIWTFSIPPKLKHFWWRSLHNVLPKAATIQKRHLSSDATCVLCGEHEETLIRLLFQCRVSKEIWELSPVIVPADVIAKSIMDHKLWLQSLSYNRDPH
ncbi:unnamed protein product, partial [Thlaspi arvense]